MAAVVWLLGVVNLKKPNNLIVGDYLMIFMGTRASTTYHTVILAFTCATSRDDLRSPWDMSPTSQESSNIHQKQKQHMESQSVFYHF